MKGKIVVCMRGINPRVEKGLEASHAGAVGFILVNDENSGNELVADPHVIPASQIGFNDGLSLLSYVNKTKCANSFNFFTTCSFPSRILSL